MVQRFAEDYEDTEYTRKTQGIAEDAGPQARNIAESFTNYVRANPTEALVMAAAAAFVIGALIALPRMQSKNERIARDFERRVRQAYEDAQRAQDSSPTWDKLAEWFSANLARRI
jgi:hypothetical protein